MSLIQNVSRRQFLTALGLGGAGLTLATALPLTAAAKAGSELPFGLGYFVSIANTGAVTIICHRAEMGQGINTSVPQIIADELGANWDRVTVQLASADSRLGDQSTGGSASIRRFYPYLRQMGAVARTMLEQAAAETWGVPVGEVTVNDHQVIHAGSGRRLGLGELAERAARLPVPEPSAVKLKPDTELKLVGRDVPLTGHQAIVQGSALYAQDVQLPGLLIASIERPPVVGGRVKSFDAEAAKQVPGVHAVLRLKDRPLPVDTRPVGGVAVLASNTWAALEARKKLKIEWELGPNASHDSDAYKAQLVSKAGSRGTTVRSDGDVYNHTFDPAQTLEATYTFPYHHHQSMETPSATAHIEAGRCTVWTGTQTPQWGKTLVMQELGLNPETDGDKVELRMTLMGGAFGRKGKNDFTVEAVELAKASGRPVKVIWSREDDVRHGYYHATAANYHKAEMTDQGVDHWIQRVVHPPIGWTFDHKIEEPADFLLQQSFADMPFALNNFSCEKHKIDTHVRIGWFRAVQNLNNAFAMSCFVDELAARAGVSTRQMWLQLIGADRTVDPRQQGFAGFDNYGQSGADYAVDTRRIKHTINYLHERAGIDKPLPKGEGWGFGYATSFNSYAACATRVRVQDKQVQLLEMHSAIDCGQVITPDRVISQMEGAMIMGISLALMSEITLKDGAVVQSNFHDYPVARMPQVPPLHVHLIDSSAAPGGVGEPGLPPVVPSIVNAIYHASGVRIRDLPVNKTLKV